jgi:hypothetical protein
MLSVNNVGQMEEESRQTLLIEKGCDEGKSEGIHQKDNSFFMIS